MSLAIKRVVLACFCAWVLAAVGCAGAPTSPSATAAASRLAATASGTAASSGSRRSGELHVTKDCSSYAGKAGDSCTFTSSNFDAIEVGATITYATALAGTTLDSDVVLNPPAPGNNLAFGHCQVDLVDLANGRGGLCTFSGGTGKFSKFHARITVSQPDPKLFIFTWDGTYYFSPRE